MNLHKQEKVSDATVKGFAASSKDSYAGSTSVEEATGFTREEVSIHQCDL